VQPGVREPGAMNGMATAWAARWRDRLRLLETTSTRIICPMNRGTMLALCMALSGCAHGPIERHEELFGDSLFAPASERISAQDVFALSDAMHRYIDTEMAGPLLAKGLHKGLIDALYSTNRLRLDYDAAMTRNASQAFEARSGNCLSLVIMTAAFAKALGLTVRYQGAFVEPMWSRVGGMHFLSGHVNVTLVGKSTGARTIYDAGELLMVDFLPEQDLRGLRTWPIPEPTIVAMYMNNRAAESLARGQLDDAYWWARAAIGQDPSFFSAYNTLGVIYLRHGDWPQAERVLRAVLEREPGNAQALSNLALALERLGRGAESDVLQRRLARIEPYPAFYFFDRGLAALRLGDFRTAKDLFAKEVERDPYYHESHYWLGIANLRLGDVREGRKHLDLALEYSTTLGEREVYAAKLEHIRSHR
jgi:Flp pilus assembly protein TadD